MISVDGLDLWDVTSYSRLLQWIRTVDPEGDAVPILIGLAYGVEPDDPEDLVRELSTLLAFDPPDVEQEMIEGAIDTLESGEMPPLVPTEYDEGFDVAAAQREGHRMAKETNERMRALLQEQAGM